MTYKLLSTFIVDKKDRNEVEQEVKKMLSQEYGYNVEEYHKLLINQQKATSDDSHVRVEVFSRI